MQTRITAHSTALLEKAVDMLTKAWKTQRFPVSQDLEAPYLRLVELPPLTGFTRDTNVRRSRLCHQLIKFIMQQKTNKTKTKKRKKHTQTKTKNNK